MDAYMVPTADFHESEYVGDHFKCRQFLTGFTGSAGIAVVTMKEADWGALFAALVLALIPTVILFIVGQKQLVQGLSVGGVKG